MALLPTVLDLETFNTAPGRQAPPPVCGVLATRETYDDPLVADWPRLGPLVREIVKSDFTYLINQNVFFDLAVVANEYPDLLPDIFKMFDEDRVYDTQVAQQLLAIAMGDKKQLIFGLDRLAQRWLGKKLTGKKGPDVWRTKYHDLHGVQFEKYPEEAARYVADDRIALDVAEAQMAFVRRASGGEADVLPTFYDQMRAAWAFHLMGAWGAQVDPEFLRPLAAQLKVHVDAVVSELIKHGIYREDGTENKKEVKRRVAEDYGETQPFPQAMEALEPWELWEVLKRDERRLLLHKNCMPLSKRAVAAMENGTAFKSKEAQQATISALVAEGYKKPRAGVYYVLKPEEIEGLRWPFTVKRPHEVPFTTKEEGGTVRLVNVKTDSETLEDSTDEVLQLRAEVSGDKKLLETYVPLLRAGTALPINPRWNVLVESGRSSCGKPNMQNQPRQPGVRECFVPRDGFLFVACDYAVAELRSLAQVLLNLFGWSKMADAVKEGKDLHLVFVQMLLGLPYEEVERRKNAKDPLIKKMRNLAKAMNFGVPGGLGAEKFVKFAKASYGIHIAEYAPQEYWGSIPKPEDHAGIDAIDKATLLDIGMRYFKEVLKPLWLDTYPEMRLYFKHIGALVQGDDPATVTHPLTGYVRGGVYYCAACNQNFQHLTAMGAKKALYEVVRECYVDCGTALFGCRPFAFIHDEIIIEAPEGRAEAAAKRLEQVMSECMKVYTPDLPADTDSGIMRRWRKGAEGSGIWEDRDLTEKEIKAIKEADSVWAACVAGGVEPNRAEEIRNAA